ncbi:MAG: carbon storage regulator CsrA [Acidimicrobiales bacterium]
MLVLSRRESQSIVIGNDIVVTVIEIRGDHVRLGIDAPRSITVHRQEVAAAIEAANKEAAQSGPVDAALLPKLPGAGAAAGGAQGAKPAAPKSGGKAPSGKAPKIPPPPPT